MVIIKTFAWIALATVVMYGLGIGLFVSIVSPSTGIIIILACLLLAKAL